MIKLSLSEKAILMYIERRKENPTTRRDIETGLEISAGSLRHTIPKMRRKGLIEEIKGKNGNIIEIKINLKELIK